MGQNFNLEQLVHLHAPTFKVEAESVGGSSSSGGNLICPNGLFPHGPFCAGPDVVGHGPHGAHDPTMIVVLVVTYLLTFGVGFLVGRLARSRVGGG